MYGGNQNFNHIGVMVHFDCGSGNLTECGVWGKLSVDTSANQNGPYTNQSTSQPVLSGTYSCGTVSNIYGFSASIPMPDASKWYKQTITVGPLDSNDNGGSGGGNMQSTTWPGAPIDF